MNNWKHLSGICFDLETLSTEVDSCIMSIGAVRFDIDSDTIDKPFRVNLNLEEGIKTYGLRRSKDTMQWWATQKKEVLKANMANAIPYKDGIQRFIDYVNEVSPNMVWAWGTHFDIPIFNYSLMKTHGEDYPKPWMYNKVCDARTLKNSFLEDITRSETAHDPLQDVIDQAQYIINFYKGISQ